MAIDTQYLIDAITEAAKEGVAGGLKLIQSKAQSHAPVRKIYKTGHGKVTQAVNKANGLPKRGAPSTLSGSQAQAAGHIVGTSDMSSYWRTRSGARVIPQSRGRATIGSAQATVLRTAVTRGGSARKIETGTAKMSIQKERIGGTIRGRVNSYEPVVKSPVGMIGGEQLRHWSSSGALETKVIHAKGKSFQLADLLTSRGAYEVRTGRAKTVTQGGDTIIGGRLHDSIKPEGPFVNGSEIYGYVSAHASDPGSDHNYARDQEFGSRHNRAHPFLRPGLRESRAQILSTTRGPLKRAFENGVRPAHGSSSATRPIVIEVELSTAGFRKAVREFNSIFKEAG